jgi:hypothetical protein
MSKKKIFNFSNMKQSKMKNLMVISATVLLVQGCASITKGTSQTIIFNLDPQTASCKFTRDGDGEIGSISSTNNTLKVSKDKDDIVATCVAPGYKQKVMRIVSKAQTEGVVGTVIDLGITDLVTGAMWAYPSDISITMEKDDSKF